MRYEEVALGREGRRGGEERGGEGRGGYVTVHALHQVTQPHRACPLTDAGEGVSYSC